MEERIDKSNERTNFLDSFSPIRKSLFQRSEAIKQIGIYRNRHKCAKKKIFYAYFL